VLILFTALPTQETFASPARSWSVHESQQPIGLPVSKARQLEFVSKVNGHRYAIRVALPLTKAPNEGYAVLYVLDGYWYFASATELVRMVLSDPVSNAVVVGIGYPEDPPFIKKVLAQRGPLPSSLAGLPLRWSAPFLERGYDLTPSADDSSLAAETVPGSPPWRSANVGGVDEFLKVIETEIKPRIANLTHINRSNQAIFGHSFGGLAVLHALFVEPDAFRTFIIASPSIWWNNKAVLADEGTFSKEVTTGRAQPRVLLTVGSEESTPQKLLDSWGLDQSAYETLLRKDRMVENVRELFARLKTLQGGPNFRVEAEIFEKEGHAASPWAALSRGVPFAFLDKAL